MTSDPYLKNILEFVKKERGLDFSEYKLNLIERRVQARVRLARMKGLQDYFDHLKINASEMDLLLDALTINVTEFFRDAEVFDVIEEKVLPKVLLKDVRGHSGKKLIWSCGSSSGQEPYSILMAAVKCLGGELSPSRFKIIATDIDEHVLNVAREGIFDENEFQKLSDARRKLVKRCFQDMGNRRYWIKEELFEYLDFVRHDVVRDEPLSDVDMIICRNLLIYFDRALQERVFENFHRALKKGGFMVLGRVETLWGSIRDKFEEFDRHARIYVKK